MTFKISRVWILLSGCLIILHFSCKQEVDNFVLKNDLILKNIYTLGSVMSNMNPEYSIRIVKDKNDNIFFKLLKRKEKKSDEYYIAYSKENYNYNKIDSNLLTLFSLKEILVLNKYCNECILIKNTPIKFYGDRCEILFNNEDLLNAYFNTDIPIDDRQVSIKNNWYLCNECQDISY